MTETDRIATLIYYIAELNIFHTVDCCARPTSKSWVVVERLATEQIVLEPFRGQQFIGVVRPLLDYFAQPAWRAQQRGRIDASARRQMLSAKPADEGPPKTKKPRKERIPFPRKLAC